MLTPLFTEKYSNAEANDGKRGVEGKGIVKQKGINSGHHNNLS